MSSPEDEAEAPAVPVLEEPPVATPDELATAAVAKAITLDPGPAQVACGCVEA